MGAHYKDYTIRPEGGEVIGFYDVKRIHLDQCAYDRDYYGHQDGYSGAFNSKEWAVVLQPGEWTADTAERHCSALNYKWGPAWAYHLKDGSWYIGGNCPR